MCSKLEHTILLFLLEVFLHLVAVLSRYLKLAALLSILLFGGLLTVDRKLGVGEPVRIRMKKYCLTED